MPGNGFSYKDFETVMKHYGLQGLSIFYPNCKFQYNKECDCIAVDQELSVLKGNIPYADDRVQLMTKGLFSWSDQPTDILESLGARISHVNYAGEDAAQLVVVEDLHLARNNADLVIKTAEALLVSRDKLIILQEFLAGPSVFDEAFAKKEWDGIKGLIDEASRTTEEDDLKDFLRYDRPTATLRTVAKEELRKLLSRVPKDTLLSIDYSNLKEAFVNYPELKSAVSTLSVATYLKVMYGDRVIILNPEYHKPTNNVSVNEEMVSPLMPSPDGRLYFANDLQIRRMGHKFGDSRHVMDPFRLTETFQRSLEGYVQWIDNRTDRWLQNIFDVISNPEMANDSPPVFLLFGGGAHMPKLSRELEGRVSSIFLVPK